MTTTTFTMHGAKELDKLLKQLGDKKLQEAARVGAVRKVGKELAEEISQRAPVDFGTLQESIAVQKRKVQGIGASVRVGLKPVAFYGMFQEFGTDMHAPQPFMRPAFEETGDETIEAVGEELRRLLGLG